MRHLNDKLLKGSNLYNLINNINQRFPDMIIYGKSTQDKTNGLNLFNINSLNDITILDRGFKFENIWSRGIMTNKEIKKKFKPNTKYTCKIIERITSRPETIVENQVSLALYRGASGDLPYTFVPFLNDSANRKTVELNVDTTYIKTFTTPTDLSNLVLLAYTFFSNGGASGCVEIREIMIVEGEYSKDTFPAYEPYTNGPAPNPDFPMPIINKKIGNIELCSIDDSKDYIKGKPGEWYLYRKIRKIELPIKDMDNLENYPGWKKQFQLVADYPNKNDIMANVTQFYCNIAYKSNPGIMMNTNFEGILYLRKLNFILNQSEWQEQYPNLIFVIQYALLTHESNIIVDKETIEVLDNMYLEKIKENQQDIVID